VGDFVAKDGSGCKLAKPACKTSGASCTLAGAGSCCSQTCVPNGKKHRCL
jgi:hypothetical protein